MINKFVKSLSENINEDLKAIKDYWYTYDKAMKNDSDEQFVCWSLMSNKILINTLLPKLLEDLRLLQELSVKNDKKNYCKNILWRTNPKDWWFKNAEDMLENFEAMSTTEEICFEQWLLRWLELWCQESINLLSDSIDKLTLLLNKY